MDGIEMSAMVEADWHFRRMVRKFVKERDKITVEGVALPGLMILGKMLKGGEQRLGNLADELDLTSGAITAICDKLEELGFAVRKRKKEDRRAVILDITDEGRALLERNRNVGRRCITLLFDGFTEQELKAHIHTFKRITDNLEHFSGEILGLAQDNAERYAARQSSIGGERK